MPDIQEILGRVQAAVAETMGLDLDAVTPSQRFFRDIDAETRNSAFAFRVSGIMQELRPTQRDVSLLVVSPPCVRSCPHRSSIASTIAVRFRRLKSWQTRSP